MSGSQKALSGCTGEGLKAGDNAAFAVYARRVADSPGRKGEKIVSIAYNTKMFFT